MRKLIALLGALMLALLALAPTAEARRGPSAGYYKITDPNSTHRANLWVAPRARIKKDGFQVRWNVEFTCPKGKRYSLNGSLGNRNPESLPPLQDGDGWIHADLKRSTGTCSGAIQRTKLTLDTVKAQWGDTDVNGQHYPAGSCWCPLVNDKGAETALRIRGKGFNAYYGANVGATFSGEARVALVGGPAPVTPAARLMSGKVTKSGDVKVVLSLTCPSYDAFRGSMVMLTVGSGAPDDITSRTTRDLTARCQGKPQKVTLYLVTQRINGTKYPAPKNCSAEYGVEFRGGTFWRVAFDRGGADGNGRQLCLT